MTIVCPTCREVVHTWQGFITTHGTYNHGKFNNCASSNDYYPSSKPNKKIRARDQRAHEKNIYLE